jgi:hypothetical protein
MIKVTDAGATAWSHLPNAALIDCILDDVRARPAAWAAARDAVQVAVNWVSVREAVREAVMALIAWDHAGSYLDMTPREIRMCSALGVPAAILLEPAVLAFNNQEVAR